MKLRCWLALIGKENYTEDFNFINVHHLVYFYMLPCTKTRTNSRFKLNLSSFCFSLVICACAQQPTDCQRATAKAYSNISSLLGLGLHNAKIHLGCSQNLQVRNDKMTKIALKEKEELVELSLDPLELPAAMKAWKMHIGLSYAGDQGPLLAHGGPGEHYMSQVILLSKLDAGKYRIQHWIEQLTLGRHHHCSPPRDVHLRQPPDMQGEGSSKKHPDLHKAHPCISEEGLKYNFQLRLCYHLKKTGKCSAQNPLSSALLWRMRKPLLHKHHFCMKNKLKSHNLFSALAVKMKVGD